VEDTNLLDSESRSECKKLTSNAEAFDRLIRITDYFTLRKAILDPRGSRDMGFNAPQNFMIASKSCGASEQSCNILVVGTPIRLLRELPQGPNPANASGGRMSSHPWESDVTGGKIMFFADSQVFQVLNRFLVILLTRKNSKTTSVFSRNYYLLIHRFQTRGERDTRLQ
jgi:hypothetical protein